MFPSSIVGGDSFNYNLSCAEYPSSDWTLHFSLRGATTYNGSASSNSDGSYALKIPAASTAAFIPGKSTYVLYVDDGVDQYTVESGTVEIQLRADLMTISDVRSNYQRIVDAIDATLEGRANSDQQAYTIAGRSISRIPVSELISLRKYYAELASRADRKVNGKNVATKLTVIPTNG